MALSFFTSHKETEASLRRKAEDLVAQAQDISPIARGKFSFGETRLNATGRDGDFRQFRNYREGDRPQDIDWKRSGRSDDVLVREREKSQQRLWDFYIQNNPGMHFQSATSHPSKYEASCILALAFALWAGHHHDPIRFAGSKTSVDALPRLILETKQQPKANWDKNAVTILLGDYTQPFETIEAELKNLTSRNVILLQVLDPAELDLPYQGRKIFEDGRIDSTVNNVDALRDGYQKNLNAHLSAVKDYARKRNWHYDLVRTDMNIAVPYNKALSSLEVAR